MENIENVLKEISGCTEEIMTLEKAKKILLNEEVKAWIHGEPHERTEDVLHVLDCILIILEKITDPEVIQIFETYNLDQIYTVEFDENSEAGEEMIHILHELSKNPAISERTQYALMDIALKYHERHIAYNLLENEGCTDLIKEILIKEMKNSHM